ncbi:hypothetical protein KY289_011436 [Solanum tuberosum]|nr:hypothetical protein KY289_011436 [Solanum tuberosum]
MDPQLLFLKLAVQCKDKWVILLILNPKGRYKGGSSPQASSPSSHYLSTHANFTYGLNTNIPPPGWGISLNQQQLMNGHAPEVSSTITPNRISQAEREVQQMLHGCTFTKDQYDHILKMVQQKSDASTVSACNTASTSGKTSSVINHSQVWIVDTGATNHMVSSLDMMVEDSVSKLAEVKLVYLLNGTTTQVSHVGSCALSARSLVTNALHVPDFKYNMLSISQLTKELGCSITFFPNFCVFQELCSGKVKEVGKEEGGLYLLMKHFTNKSDSSPGKEVAFTVNNTKVVDLELWHQRLGHVSSAVLARMFAMSQQTMFDGSKYFPTIVDDFSRMTWKWAFCIKDHVLILLSKMVLLKGNIGIYLRLSSSVLKYETPYKRLVRSAVRMGYSEIHKGYILFDLGKISFFVSRDVVFREDQFHFAQVSSPAQEKLFPDSLHDSAATPSLDYMLSLQCPTTACPSRVSHDETELPLSNVIPGPEVAPDEVVADSIPNGSRLVSESRRSSRHKQPPVWMKDFVSCPLNKALESNHTWEIIDLPPGKRPIGCRWIYKVKYKSTGEVERFKARLVAKGYSQQEGIEQGNLFSSS